MRKEKIKMKDKTKWALIFTLIIMAPTIILAIIGILLSTQ